MTNSDFDYPIKMYPGINVFVREDGETPEDQIFGVKSDDKIHSLERYIQECGSHLILHISFLTFIERKNGNQL